MIRQKVYQLEQAQIKMKAEYVILTPPTPPSSLRAQNMALTNSPWCATAMKPRFACCDTSSNRVVCNPSPLISRLHSIPAPRRSHLHSVTAAACSVVSWSTKEVVVPVPVLPLPHPWISSLPSMPFIHSLLRPLAPLGRNPRRARLEDIRLALL